MFATRTSATSIVSCRSSTNDSWPGSVTPSRSFTRRTTGSNASVRDVDRRLAASAREGRRRRTSTFLLLAAAVTLVAGTIAWGAGARFGGVAAGPDSSPTPARGSASVPPSGDVETPVPSPTARPPIGGTELFGYVPYWQ